MGIPPLLASRRSGLTAGRAGGQRQAVQGAAHPEISKVHIQHIGNAICKIAHANLVIWQDAVRCAAKKGDMHTSGRLARKGGGGSRAFQRPPARRVM